MKIPITKPFLGKEEREAVQAPLESGWIVQGPTVKKFEDKFNHYTNAPHSIATTSCTTALHISVAALGLKPGDEVIVPAFTWVATPNVVEYMGAKPIFCDIDLSSFNIDPNNIEPLITSKTVGIIPVHLFGLLADMDPIMSIARKHKLWVVEDAACAFGGYYKGKHAGLFGETGCFSFHPRKSITTGEGGMITTLRDDFDSLCRSLRDHGASKTDLTRHTEKQGFLLPDYPHLGYNFRMTDIQAAIGCAQLDKANFIMKERHRIADNYNKNLSDVAWLKTPVVPKNYVHGYQSYVCLFSPEKVTPDNFQILHEKRNNIMLNLEEQGVSTRQGTHAPVETAFYKKKYGINGKQFPISIYAEKLSISLPLYPQMTSEEQDYVIQKIKEVRI